MYYDIKGEDIYLYTGNDSWSPINNMLHQAVAVDVWSDDCPPVKIGIRGFSFAFFFEFKWNWGSKTWLGQPSVTLPGLVMVGEIYDIDDVPGKVVKQKHTTYQQDKAWLEKMESKVGTKDVYSVGRHNCRAFSQAEFEKAP